MKQPVKKPLIFLLAVSLLTSVVFLGLNISGKLQTSQLPWKKLQPDSQTQLQQEADVDLSGTVDAMPEPTGAASGDEIGSDMAIEPDGPVGNDIYSGDGDDDLDEQSYTWTSKKEQTVFDLLQDQADVEYEQYDFGVMIKSINGLTADNQYYWAFYVNGEYSQVGADQAQLQPGDEVKWVWETIDN